MQNILSLCIHYCIGQLPPGITPEIFAPGFISTENREFNSVFTPDGKEFYYSNQTPGSGNKQESHRALVKITTNKINE